MSNPWDQVHGDVPPPPKTKKAAPKRKKNRGKPAPAGHWDHFRPVKVFLRTRHLINDVPYGPGEVRVSQGLASVLLDSERKFQEAEEQFQGTKAAIIGSRTSTGYRVHPVAPEAFDGAYATALPVERISGHDTADLGPGPKF